MQDTRVGRFLSIDPLTKSFPHYSPYQFAGNTPIQAIDLDGAEEYDYRLIVKNGKAQLKLTNVKYFNHHSWFGGLIEFDTKITPKRYIVHYDNQTYHIGFAQYGVGYSNSAMAQDFEKNYVANKNNVDEIAFEYNYYNDNISQAVSDVNIVVQSQNFSAETALPMGGKLPVVESVDENLSTWKGPLDYSHLDEPRKVGPGLETTTAQRKRILEYNRQQNGGVIRSDEDGTIADIPTRVPKGGKANMNQAEVDHKEERVNGGSNSNKNQRVVTKRQNLDKEVKRRR